MRRKGVCHMISSEKPSQQIRLLSEDSTMKTITDRSRNHAAILMILLPTALFLLAGCGFYPFGVERREVDLAPFKERAKASGCADIRSQLFLIDDQLVFWDIAGNCADASYSEMLFDSTPDQVLCSFHDSIAGPIKECQDEQYQDLFDVITANLDKPDLGLGAAHTVQSVPF
jgi:hypothetical protein